MTNTWNMTGGPAPAGAAESAQAERERWAGEIGPVNGTATGPTWRAPAAGTAPAAAGTPFSSQNGQMSQTHGLEMHNDLPQEVVESPTTLNEAYIGSLKATMLRNKGSFVVATFLIGTQNTVSWEGILYDVGNDYVTIYQLGRDRYIVCDIYSLKYIEFYDTRRRQVCNQLLQEQGQEPLW